MRRLRFELLSARDRWGKMLLSGSEHAFAEIYKKFRKPVLLYSLRRVKDREHAEDMTQEVFTKLYKSRATYQPHYPFLPWFWTLVRNSTQDWMRKGVTVKETVEADLSDPESGGRFLDGLHSPGKSAEVRAIQKCWRKGLLKKLKSLTRLQQKVLWLRFVHDLSYDEISRKLGISLASVKCLIYRARTSLKPELRGAVLLAPLA